jgi:diaminobutyrate-2-oxoglutarate transaminase
MGIFEDRESAARSYCRVWPKVFDRAAGSWLYDEAGRAYLDFFTGGQRSKLRPQQSCAQAGIA